MGDASLIFFTAFAVNYNLSLWIVFWAAFIGNMIGDSGWFGIGRLISPHIERYKKIHKGYEKIAEVIEFIFKKKHFIALTAVKFLYGTRVITIIYMAKEKLKFRKFAVYNIFATLLWIFGVGLVGYFVGLGYVWVKQIFQGVGILLTIIVIFFIAFYFLQREINVKLEHIRIKMLKKIKKAKK